MLLLLTGFQAYNQLNLHQRADLVRSASGCLSSWKATPALRSQSNGVPPSSTSNRHTSPTPTAQPRRQLHQSAMRAPSNSAATGAPTATIDQPSPAHAWAQPSTNAQLGKYSADSATLQAPIGNAGQIGQPTSASALTQQSTGGQPARSSVDNTSLQAPIAKARSGQNGQTITISPFLFDSFAQSPRNTRFQPSNFVPASSPATNGVKALGEEPAMELAQTDAMLVDAVSHAPSATNANSYSHSSVDTSSDASVDVLSSTDATHSESVLPNMASRQTATESSLDMSASSDADLTAQPDDSETTSLEMPAAKKLVMPETLAFQASFALSAAAAAKAAGSKIDFQAGGQRSQAWFDLRQSRLTASAFANAIG